MVAHIIGSDEVSGPSPESSSKPHRRFCGALFFYSAVSDKEKKGMAGIVLLEPEIPANTGNIGRTCVATGTSLHLIDPLGFQLTERNLKRAGMDYWNRLDVHRYRNYQHFLDEHQGSRIWYATTKAKRTYADALFAPDDFIMFGRESAGIPEEILVENEERCIRIPMLEGERSLNLSNSVSIILYELLRQNRFEGMQQEGELHRLRW